MSAPWPTLQAPPNYDRPPWGWNPTQTFIDAYNIQRIADQKVEEMEIAREMDRILFPIKQQQAQLSLEKMQLEMERTKGEIERQRILTRQMTDTTRNVNRGFNGGLVDGPEKEDPFSFKISTTAQKPVAGGKIKLPE